MDTTKKFSLLDKFNPELYEVDDSFGNCLGRGTYGQVFSGKLRDQQSGIDLPPFIAVKKILLKKRDYEATEFTFCQYLGLDFKNENLVQMFYLEKQKIGENYFFNIYMEMCQSTLEKEIRDKEMTRQVIRHASDGILRGLNYLHKHGVLHRDLKPPNILVKKGQKNCDFTNSIIKLADYGTLRLMMTDEDEETLTANMGSHGYKSPEVRWDVNNKTKYGLPSDIWAVGAVIYWVSSGENFMDDENILKDNYEYASHLKMKIARLNEDTIDKDFLEKLLKFSSQDRITCEQALIHPFIIKH